MDQSYSESDISLSPSQILERLHLLRQLQLMQRGKLQKQRLEYDNTPETPSSISEIVSHFSNSTSYNTFRSLLQSSNDASNEVTPRVDISTEVTPRGDASALAQKVRDKDLIEGVSVLNLSQESEFIVNSPLSSRSKASNVSNKHNENNEKVVLEKTGAKKQISLEDMPILSPKKDFEALILEKLQGEKNIPKIPKKVEVGSKKTFLKRGEGMARFGLKKNDLVIQNTKSLPWKRQSFGTKLAPSPIPKNKIKKADNKVHVEIVINESKDTLSPIQNTELKSKKINNPANIQLNVKRSSKSPNKQQNSHISSDTMQSAQSSNIGENSLNIQPPKLQLPTGKHPLLATKGKTWAAILTKEQDDFLRQLKQSDYYKNFASPAKSTRSDMSCDENLTKVSQEREHAEQNMFELLENKVCHESFNLESSFFNRFLKKNNLECSGESTPLIMQKCLAKNPDLLHIVSGLKKRYRHDTTCTEPEPCDSEYTDCCSDACSTVSCSCSCKTVEEMNSVNQTPLQEKCRNIPDTKANTKKVPKKKVEIKDHNKDVTDDTVTESDITKANMAEMNEKLIATSELLKDRLRELEDEIETFRKENSNLAKMREEVDLERKKFYEEKSAFEQKFNEEKVLSEYYLAEEKEKLTKQKQTYERYVREMRGRLNKKDKDEVISLKKEISDLKEEIRLKDAKSTSTIARLRNQIKIMDKEKKDLQDEVEKLKKENRRIQHSNDITRRLSNFKYLAEINKKLNNMTSKESRSEVDVCGDAKYKAFEIERQSRSRKVQQPVTTIRPRAKSVPNLNVTSRYAKYFSQRDAASISDRNETVQVDIGTYTRISDDENNDNSICSLPNDDDPELVDQKDDSDESYLEKIYMERFQSTSPSSRPCVTYKTIGSQNNNDQNDGGFFIRKSNSLRSSNSPNRLSPGITNFNGSISNRSKSPVSLISHRSSTGQRSPTHQKTYENPFHASNGSNPPSRQKSPVSILSHRSSKQKSPTLYNQNSIQRMTPSPEPTTSKTSITKTNLNPTEIKKPDGSKELRFPNGNIKYISADGNYSKFVYYNGDVKENFYNEGRIKYFYAETKTIHTTHADGLEVLEFPDGQVEKRYKDGSSEIRLPNGAVRYHDPKNSLVREEWRFPDGATLSVSADGERRAVFANGQVEVHAPDHKRREFPDGTVKLVYNDGTSETRYASGRVRVKDKHGNLIMDSAPR